MTNNHTPGPWAHDKRLNLIYSQSAYLVTPSIFDDEEGVPMTVISTFAAMGGNDIEADVALIVAAPEMLGALIQIYEHETRCRDLDCATMPDRLYQLVIDTINKTKS